MQKKLLKRARDEQDRESSSKDTDKDKEGDIKGDESVVSDVSEEEEDKQEPPPELYVSDGNNTESVIN